MNSALRIATEPGDGPAPRPRRRRPALRPLVSAAILGALAWKLDWAQVAAAFRGARWHIWLAAVGLFLGTQVVSAVRWQWLARPLGFGDPLRRFIRHYFVGMFFNLLLPTSVGGDVVRAVGLNAGSGRKTAATLSVLLDRLSGLVVLLALACVAAIAYPMPLPAWVGLAVGGAAVAAVTGLMLLPVSARLIARLDGAGTGRWHALLGTAGRVAGSVQDALAVYRGRPKLVLASGVLSLLVQVAGVVQVAWIGAALNLDVPVGVYGVAVPMVALLTLLPVSVSGMGVREAGMVLFLQPAGVAAGPAVTVAFLWFCVQTAGGVVGAGVYLSGRAARPEVGHGGALGDRSGEGRARQHRAAA